MNADGIKAWVVLGILVLVTGCAEEAMSAAEIRQAIDECEKFKLAPLVFHNMRGVVNKVTCRPFRSDEKE